MKGLEVFNSSSKKKVKELIKLIKDSHRIFVLTGAGISTESGIPDFRSGTGLYSKYPEYVFDIDVFYENPNILYSLMYELVPIFLKAQPNDGHKCLKKLEDMGKLLLIATQNIDMLHEKAGNKKVAELHGSIRTFTCIRCGKKFLLKYVLPFLERKEIPRCDKCEGVLRPDFVFFKEPLPYEALKKTEEAIIRSDLMLVIGSSLVVYPAASLPMLGITRGIPLVIITKGETPLDPYAILKIEEDIGKVCKAVMLNL